MNPALHKDLERSRKSNDTEDIWDVLFTNRLGMIMTRLFIRLRFTPNMVTILAMVFGVCGGILFYPADIRLNVIGILLEIFAAVLDCSDGQVARLTNMRTRLGRVLDGICDGLCFAAMYLALGFRLMNEPIPFSGGTLWGFWIFPIVFFSGLACHQEQSRIADYYRNVHLFFLNNAYGSELSRSASIRSELDALPKHGALPQRLFLGFYYFYTKAQEARTPQLQRLLEKIEQDGSGVSAEITEAYVTESRRYIQLTNLLTYNLRAYTLFLLVLLRIPVFFFAFEIIALSLLCRFTVKKYEQIAADLLAEDVL